MGKGFADDVPIFVEALKEARDGRGVGRRRVPVSESAGEGSINIRGVADGFLAGPTEDRGAEVLGESEEGVKEGGALVSSVARRGCLLYTSDAADE